MAKQKENAVVSISSRQLADGIYSMWIQTQAADTAKPGQFISMYTTDGSKLLPRPISICEIDKEAGNASSGLSCDRRKYRNGAIFQLKYRRYIPVIGPLGKWISTRKQKEKSISDGRRNRCTSDSGTAKQMECEEKQIVVGYRDAQTVFERGV